jgi:hypothetical protein
LRERDERGMAGLPHRRSQLAQYFVLHCHSSVNY